LNLEEFIHEMDYEKNNIRSGYLFEALVLKILDKYLEDQSKILIPSKKFKLQRGVYIEYDGYIPAGIDDLPGGTAVEIKLFKGNKNVFDNSVKYFSEVQEINSLLYIFGSKLTSNDKKRLYKIFDGISIKIWDYDDLLKISKKYSQYISEIIPQLSETELNKVVSKSLEIDPNDWKNSRDEHINKLKDIYKKDDLVLFLGAGISNEADVPDWKTLVSDLFARMIDEKLIENRITMNEYEKQEIKNELKSINEGSPLLQARYIRTGLGSSFLKILSELVYKNINDSNYGTSAQLKSIAKLCSPIRRKLGIRAVVTYNFDDLIEKNLEMIGIDFKSIFRDVDIASQEELGIYHVHGFLPRDFNENEIISDNLLVFSEERYHSFLKKDITLFILILIHGQISHN